MGQKVSKIIPYKGMRFLAINGNLKDNYLSIGYGKYPFFVA